MTYLCDDMRHLICAPYSRENLHRMAEDLNIKRCWYDGDHYDIPKRRTGEIQEKAEVVSPKRILKVLKQNGKR